MNLLLEIPIPNVEEFISLADMPFGLAHLFLQPGNEAYKLTHQKCLLDNSMFELGEPLPIDELLKAAVLANPVAVIAPDWLHDKDRTLQAAEDLRAARPHNATWSVGALVQGKDLLERLECFQRLRMRSYSPIGFPARSPRSEVLTALVSRNALMHWQWYHLFGLRDMDELSLRLPGHWSIDTGKPFKGFRLDLAEQIRGHGRLPLDAKLCAAHRYNALYNIAWMRKLMA